MTCGGGLRPAAPFPPEGQQRAAGSRAGRRRGTDGGEGRRRHGPWVIGVTGRQLPRYARRHGHREWLCPGADAAIVRWRASIGWPGHQGLGREMEAPFFSLGLGKQPGVLQGDPERMLLLAEAESATFTTTLHLTHEIDPHANQQNHGPP